jgi:tight adherence protein B
LRRLDATIRARNQVAGAVRSLTAEGRISGIVLSALPPGLMLAVQFLNPEFMEPMFSTATGKLLLVIGSVQLIVGSFWLSRMARFKF